jgi:hypothetical protein
MPGGLIREREGRPGREKERVGVADMKRSFTKLSMLE